MRILEMILAGIIFIALVLRSFPKLQDRSAGKSLPFAAGFLIPLHLALEGCRWQMVPLFIFLLALITLNLIELISGSRTIVFFKNRVFRVFANFLIYLIYVLCLLFPILLPVVDLPQPGGPYPVGITSLRLIDPNRDEIFTEDPADHRNLLVTIWYPAEISPGMSLSSYWDQERVTGRTYAISTDVPPYWYTHLSLVKTNSYRDAPVSPVKEAYPVILYSHAFYGLNTENTMLFEELASSGYIVFSVAHTYETIVSIFPDGDVIPGNSEYIAELFNSYAEIEKQLYHDFQNTANQEEKLKILQEILVVDEFSDQLMKTRTEDLIFLLDELNIINNSAGIFQSRLDLDRVGVMGWSFGGAAAGEACIADQRLKAGINIDGWPYGEFFNSNQTITQPFMMIRSQADADIENLVSDLVYEKINQKAYILTIKDAWHASFWDFPLFFKLYPSFGYGWPIDPLRLLEINSAYIKAFFNQHLLGVESDLLQGNSDLYPEVMLRVKNP